MEFTKSKKVQIYSSVDGSKLTIGQWLSANKYQ